MQLNFVTGKLLTSKREDMFETHSNVVSKGYFILDEDYVKKLQLDKIEFLLDQLESGLSEDIIQE